MVLEKVDHFAESGAYQRPFEIDRKRPAAIQVYEDLRARIVSIDLEPGASLSRPALADYYGVSQTPVRDALKLLEEEQLIEVYPQSKTLVSKINVEQSRETQFLRTAFEIEVARTLAARTDKTCLNDAREAIRWQRVVLETEETLVLFRQLDFRFHAALSEAAGQANLWRLIASRCGHIDRLRNLHLPDAGKTAKVVADHERILAAVEASDMDGAAEAVRLHLSDTLSNVAAIAQKYPVYF